MGRHWTWIAPSALVLVLVLGGVWLVATPTGLTTALNLADRLLPGQLAWTEARGRLIGPLTVSDLVYDDGRQRLGIGHLALAWTPAALVRGTLRLDRLEVQELELVLPGGRQQTKSPLTLPDLRPPLALEIWEARLEDLQLVRDGQRRRLARLELVAAARGREVRLETLTATGPTLQLQARGTLTPEGLYPLNLNLDWWLAPEPGLRLEGRGSLSGTLGKKLTIRHRLSGLAGAELDVTLHDALTTAYWTGGLELTGLDLGLVRPELAEQNLQGRLQSWGGLDDYRLEAELTLPLPDGTWRGTLMAEGDRRRLQIASLLLEGGTGQTLTAQGKLDYGSGRFDLRGGWRESLGWPLTEPHYRSGSGRFRLDGTLEDLLNLH